MQRVRVTSDWIEVPDEIAKALLAELVADELTEIKRTADLVTGGHRADGVSVSYRVSVPIEIEVEVGG